MSMCGTAGFMNMSSSILFTFKHKFESRLVFLNCPWWIPDLLMNKSGTKWDSLTGHQTLFSHFNANSRKCQILQVFMTNRWFFYEHIRSIMRSWTVHQKFFSYFGINSRTSWHSWSVCDDFQTCFWTDQEQNSILVKVIINSCHILATDQEQCEIHHVCMNNSWIVDEQFRKKKIFQEFIVDSSYISRYLYEHGIIHQMIV